MNLIKMQIPLANVGVFSELLSFVWQQMEFAFFMRSFVGGCAFFNLQIKIAEGRAENIAMAEETKIK